MIGSWLLYLIPGLVGTGLLGLVATKRGRRVLKRARGKLRRKAVRDTKAAVRAHRNARAATPRGQLRAKRRAQPPRLTFGHRRRPDDPTLARRAARGAKGAARRVAERRAVNRMNRRAQRTPRQPRLLELGRRLSAPPSVNRQCGSTATHDGTPCRNRCTPGHDHCYLHIRRAA